MNSGAAMLELIIHARERGELDEPRLVKSMATLESRIARLQERQARRERNRGPECARCGVRTRAGLLCHMCQAAAPAQIRNAFAEAQGFDGMRGATRLVLDYARGLTAREEVAA